MTIEQFAQAERELQLQNPSAWERIIEECAQKGHYVIPAELLRHLGNDIVVTVHGYPDQMDQRGFMHCHDFFELIYVYRGTYHNCIENEHVVMQAGSMMLLNTKVLHAPYVERREDLVFNLLIDKRFVQEELIMLLAANEVLFPFFYNCLHSGDAVKEYLVFNDVSPQSCRLMEDIVLEFAQKERYFQEVLRTSLTTLLLRLSRDATKPTAGELNAAASEPFESLLHQYISQHTRTATLTGAADHLTYTPAYLSRKIRQRLGITFSCLLNDYRMHKACEYLKATDMPMEEIAKAIGYVDASHFIRKFKEHEGMTPGEYRKSFEEARAEGKK